MDPLNQGQALEDDVCKCLRYRLNLPHHPSWLSLVLFAKGLQLVSRLVDLTVLDQVYLPLISFEFVSSV